MISGAEVSSMEPAPIVWITGLSGTGKSTLAQALVGELQGKGHRPLLLDGDALRDALESSEDAMLHDVDRRVQRAWRLARLAQHAASQGVPVVVATISLFNAVQEWNRAGLAPYAEVLMDASVDTLRNRKPELYGASDIRAPHHVVGLDIVAEFPRQPELVLVQRFDCEDLPRHISQVLSLWHDLTRRNAPRV